MTIAVGPLLESVSTTLLDTARRGWPLQSDLVPWLNEAVKATVTVKPDAYVRREYMTPAAGVDQVIPDDGVALMNVIQNADGSVITDVDGELLDEANRFWPRATQAVAVEHFTADPRDPRRFRVTPPNSGAGSILVLYGAVPEPITGSSGEELPLTATFEPPLIAYVLSKCYAKNSKKQDLSKAAAYKTEWANLLGLKTKGQVAVAPKVAVSEGKA